MRKIKELKSHKKKKRKNLKKETNENDSEREENIGEKKLIYKEKTALVS